MELPAFRCLIFVAVSTAAQAADDKASLDTQLLECRAACERQGWLVARELALRGQSRSYYWLHQIVADSPEYAALVAAVESHQVNLIVCWRYDRLWRGYLQGQVQALCAQHGVQIYAVQEPLLPKAPDELHAADEGELLQMLSGWNARREIQTLQARRRLGIARRIERGLHGCVAMPPYGYARGQPGQPFAVVPEEAAVVRRIFELRAQGLGHRAILAAITREGARPRSSAYWSLGSLTTILHNSYYVGEVHWGHYHATGAHEPLITRETWERAEAMRGRHGARVEPAGHLLTGIMRCGFCGHAMSYHVNKGLAYVRCTHYCNTGGRECRSNAMRADPVEEAVRAQIVAILTDPSLVWERVQRDESADQARLAELEAAIVRAVAGLTRWDAAYEQGVLTLEEYAARRERAASQAAVLRQERDALLHKAEIAASRQERLVGLSHLAQAVGALEPDELRALYHELLERVVLRQGEPPELILR